LESLYIQDKSRRQREITDAGTTVWVAKVRNQGDIIQDVRSVSVVI